jgi:hypothetical protein
MELRLNAARAAVPFEKPKLATTNLNGNLALGIRTREEWVAELAKLE